MTANGINNERLNKMIEDIIMDLVEKKFPEKEKMLTKDELAHIPVGTILKATFRSREEGLKRDNCLGYFFGWGCISRISGHVCWIDAVVPFCDEGIMKASRSSYSGPMPRDSNNYDVRQLVPYDKVYITRATNNQIKEFEFAIRRQWGKKVADEVFSRHLPTSTPGAFVETTVKTTVIEQSSKDTDVKKKPAYVPFDDEARQLRPFVTKVLVCNGEGTMWIPAVFGCYKDNDTARGTYRQYVAVGGNVYSYCIPF